MITEDENWLPISQAAVVLGVSERTIRNYINSDKLPVHKDRGRTYVDVSAMMQSQETIRPSTESVGAAASPPAGEENQENALMKIIGAELALRGQVQEMADRADREVDHLRQDLKAARRFGRLGWTITALCVLAAGVGGVWYAAQWARIQQRLTQAESSLESAENSAGDDLEIREQTIDRLAKQLEAVNASLEAERARLLARVESEATEKSARAKAQAEQAAKIEMLATDLASAEKSIQSLRAEKDALAEELKAERARLAQAIENRATIWEKHLADQVQTQGRIMVLESDLARSREQIDNLEETISALKAHAQELAKAKAAAEEMARGEPVAKTPRPQQPAGPDPAPQATEKETPKPAVADAPKPADESPDTPKEKVSRTPEKSLAPPTTSPAHSQQTVARQPAQTQPAETQPAAQADPRPKPADPKVASTESESE